MNNTETTTSERPGFEPMMRLVRDEQPASGDGAQTFAGFTPMNDQPGLADRKAMFVLAVSGMLLSTLLFFAPKLHTLLRPEAVPLVALAAIIAVVVLVTLAGRCAYAAYSMAAAPRPGNVMFVQNVASSTLGEFEQEIRSHAPEDALRLTLDYNHTMACLGGAKFRLVGRALTCLRVALPIWMLLLLVLGLKG